MSWARVPLEFGPRRPNRQDARTFGSWVARLRLVHPLTYSSVTVRGRFGTYYLLVPLVPPKGVHRLRPRSNPACSSVASRSPVAWPSPGTATAKPTPPTRAPSAWPPRCSCSCYCQVPKASEAPDRPYQDQGIAVRATGKNFQATRCRRSGEGSTFSDLLLYPKPALIVASGGR